MEIAKERIGQARERSEKKDWGEMHEEKEARESCIIVKEARGMRRMFVMINSTP